jgi:peptidoglycan/LPS O-acetylase OafA/YrhL
VIVPDTDERAYRGPAEAWLFRLRVPLLALYGVVAVGVAWAGTREDSGIAALTIPSFALASLAGYLSPALSPLLPLVGLAGGMVAANVYSDGIENEASGINLVGGLLIAEVCVFLGRWSRRRHQSDIAASQGRDGG